MKEKVAGLVSFLIAAGCKTVGNVAPAPPAVTPWIGFAKDSGEIRFDVTINGVPAKARLDTGAPLSMIKSEFANAHGIGVKKRGLYVRRELGSKKVDGAEDFRVAFVGNTGPQGEGVLVQDALIFEERENGPDVVLGLQFFRNLVVQVDYPNHQFRYMTRSASTIASDANMKVKIGEDGMMLVEVIVHGLPQWVVLDTGSPAGLYLSRRAARTGRWLDHAKPAGQTQLVGLVREADVDLMVLDSVKVGPYELVDVPMLVQNLHDAGRTRTRPSFGTAVQYFEVEEEESHAVLGYEVLRHFVVTMDLEEKLLHLYGP